MEVPLSPAHRCNCGWWRGGIGIAIMTGVRRGIFSNEAGVGSVPNAAATADATHPVQQGFIQSFGVYVATFFVCGATAFIILLTGKYNLGSAPTGIELAQVSLGACFGNIATQLLSIIIFLFAFSTIIGNYYYAEIIIAFFKHDNNKLYMNIFRVIVVITVFIGGLQDLSLVWESTDLIMGSTSVPPLLSKNITYWLAAQNAVVSMSKEKAWDGRH